MAIFYTDVAQNQRQGVNFPGQPGDTTLTPQPGSQNNPLLEGPYAVVATFIWTGAEAVGDIINVCIADAGYIVDPNGQVSSGPTAPAATLTVAIGDNDLALASALPVVNPQQIVAQPGGYQAPLWVSGTSYVAGNVAYDAASTPANQVFTCLKPVSGSTAPHSDSTNWVANQVRYSTSLDIHAASGNVSWAGGTQLWGGPPIALVTGTLPTGYTANQLIAQPYQIRNDCWIQAVILTASTIVANTVSVFRFNFTPAN